MEAAIIDSAMIGVEGVRSAYATLIYTAKLSDEAQAAYISKHLDPTTISERNGGAHFTFLQNFLARNGTDFVVGDGVTIADISFFDIVDLHMRLFDSLVRDRFPSLAAHHDRIAAIPTIAAYLASPRRQAKINGNDLG